MKKISKEELRNYPVVRGISVKVRDATSIAAGATISDTPVVTMVEEESVILQAIIWAGIPKDAAIERGIIFMLRSPDKTKGGIVVFEDTMHHFANSATHVHVEYRPQDWYFVLEKDEPCYLNYSIHNVGAAAVTTGDIWVDMVVAQKG